MALNEISLAISPYIARVNKAIKFYETNIDKTLASGLMLCIAEGPTGGWPTVESVEQAPLPSLSTTQLTNVIGFKRFASMNFVVSDEAGVLTVGGITWTKVTGDTQEDLIANALSQGARWLYIEAELETSEFSGETYRQVGLYSELEIDTTAVPGYATTLVYTPTQIIRTGVDPDYVYDGILEVFQNKYPVTRPTELKELFTWVLEF